jgi:hypothetical protein
MDLSAYNLEVIKNGTEHVIKDHRIKAEDITSQMKEKIRALIPYT